MPEIIDLNNYSKLNNYELFAENTITNLNSGNIIINNGYWHSPTLINLLIAGIPPSGEKSDEISVTEASNELDELINDIRVVTSNIYEIPIINNTDQTFMPNKSYKGNNIIYDNNILIFDGENDETSQFFITDKGSDGIILRNITIKLIRGAKSSNIFWVSDQDTGNGGVIVITPKSNFYGNIIKTDPVNPSVESTISITMSNYDIYGRIYSKSKILFNSDYLNIYSIDYNINNTNPPGSTNGPVVCYAKGTLILTKRGFVPIEHIKAGNMVVTKGKIFKNKFINKNAKLEISPVIWISKFKVNNLNSESRPIIIKKNALAINFPFKDLYVSPNHALLINGKMCIAKNIVNGITIYQDNECDNVEYYHLECKKHSAIIANGILSESYLHANNRFVFENNNKLHNRLKHIIKK